ncbi:hypothetical protein [Aquibacillus sediminis]|uniref:hypothetical protein n=1 Tax=Aquibacillus sediminis TaxID=2574734 RepID=UPI00110954F3|nr:hypothetical protein [Aquibacillus sediminis]
MIENLFIKKNNPLILQDCTLFIGLDYYDINTTYIFTKQNTNKVEQFRHEWVQNHLKKERVNKGYFSSPPYSDFIFPDKFIDRDDIAIIGYNNGVRYFVEEVQIEDTKFGGYFAAKFSFSNYKRIKRN